MLFNSFEFLAFFIVVTTLYFALPHRGRWLMLLLASCTFYMFFVPIYILILFATILIDWYAGIWIEETSNIHKKRLYLVISIISVCGILFVFKYFNFFNDNAAAIARALDWNYSVKALRIILPIGLSFHTFQSLSYVVEVYRGKQKAERHFGIYALYVMYFPQLVAGPIERPQNLLHQFHEVKYFDGDRFRSGLHLALWGLFKKVVVADCLSVYVDTIYNSAGNHTGVTLLLATYFFTFQIYCDFSGYSDIARGVSRIYGIELMKNFETPYFSTSVGEFWSRWHISLSTWFRDYVYIPMGGNRVRLLRNFWNIWFVFLLSGLWHGANWTFVVWGALHGTYLIAERVKDMMFARFGLSHGSMAGPLRRVVALMVTFHLVLVSWVFFRANNVTVAFDILHRIITIRGPIFWDPIVAQGILGIVAVIGLDLFNYRSRYLEERHRFPQAFRVAYSAALVFVIVLFGIERGAQFIYFQF